MRWRRAGGTGSNINVLLWALAAISIAATVVGGGYFLLHKGTEKSSSSTSKLSSQLWGRSAPAVDVSVNDGVATISVSAPKVSGVAWNTNSWPPTLSISGVYFGSAPRSGQIALKITDNTRGWSIDNASLQIGSWSNTQIVIASLQNYGNSRYLSPKDSVTIEVTNPQTGQVASFLTTYPEQAPQPVVKFDPRRVLGEVTAGQSYTLWGSLRFGGQPLANQVISFSGPGSFANTSVMTDALGKWTAIYTAPKEAGPITLTAAYGSVSGMMQTKVIPDFAVSLTATANQTDNNVTLTATVNQPLNGYTLSILNQTTGQVLGRTKTGTTLSVQIAAVSNQTDTFVAQIE